MTDENRPHDHNCGQCDMAEFAGLTYVAAHTAPLPLPSAGDLRAEVERLLANITPGEWSVAPCSDTDETRDVVAGYTERQEEGRTIRVANWIAELTGDFDFGTDEEAEFQRIEANAQFIAAAPRLLRALLASLAQVTQQIAEERMVTEAAEAAEMVYHVELEEAKRQVATLSASLDAAQAEITRLQGYVQHKAGCVGTLAGAFSCSCGLDPAPLPKEPTTP